MKIEMTDVPTIHVILFILSGQEGPRSWKDSGMGMPEKEEGKSNNV